MICLESLERKIFYLQKPGQPDEVVGTTNHRSITKTVIALCSNTGKREDNIKLLEIFVRSAKKDGSTRESLREACQIGARIGNEIKNNSGRQLNDMVIYH